MVTIHGLVKKNGERVPQTFQRTVSKLGDVCEFDPAVALEWAKSEHIPSRPPSKLPPPGNEHLSVALGQTIGNGRVGTVHPIKLYTHETDLPPLVVKISRYKSSESIEKEAWCYEELEQVQGIAVPRCYGLFQVRVEEDMEVLTWTDPRYVKRQKFDPWGRPIEETGDPTLLSILVLERLGERMALRQPDYTAIKYSILFFIHAIHLTYLLSAELMYMKCTMT
ncbi:hypothetical protein Clacol_004213 [Clathrus columnatus]|uniref:Uncharacterized protein n=1 Tax=Clathrus columnatus TaxID=1419009 RepID=A0AAV5A8X9_9AGAM|nr:hypothetical protein Clacol_004213 [Clathrus columnatus]